MDNVYSEAARILRELDMERDSFRNLVFQSSYINKKQLFKICLETLKRKPILHEIASECPEMRESDLFADNPYLMAVLLYEFLYGINGLALCRNRTWRKTLERFESQLAAAKNRLEAPKRNENGSNGTQASDQTDQERIPRYARINTLKCQMDEVLKCLEEDGCVKVDVEGKTRKSYLKTIMNLKVNEFCVDPDLENILVFAPGTDLHQYRLVTDARLILQDKSSCLATTCLNPSPGDTVIDACAAPGMKTSHLAALMKNQGQIFSIDDCSGRLKPMGFLLEHKGVTCVEMTHQDFLKVDFTDEKFKKVTHILLDPTCSGSGIVNRAEIRLDGELKYVEGKKRINALGNLQAMLLKKVLRSKLPELRRIVYSTCSIHKRENEEVVKEALEIAPENGFQLANALEKWKHRGSKKFEFGKLCLRASPKKDRTNGFFVAVFEKMD